MALIGIPGEGDALVLWNGRDFKWAFENVDENWVSVDFPDGQLYFEFRNTYDVVVGVWYFTISGSTATLFIDNDIVAALPKGAKWQLVWRDQDGPSLELDGGDASSVYVAWDADTTGGDPIARGTVTKVS